MNKMYPISKIKTIVCMITLIGSSVHAFEQKAKVFHPCTGLERWEIEPRLLKETEEEFKSFILNQSRLPRAFAESLSLRTQARFPIEKLFAEYWMTRILHEAGFLRLAHRGYQVIFQKSVSEKNDFSSFSDAALICLKKIHEKVPTLPFSNPFEAVLLKSPHSDIRDQFLLKLIESKIANRRETKTVRELAKQIQNDSPLRVWAETLIAIQDKNWKEAEKNLILLKGLSHPELDKRSETITLTRARVFYSTKQYKLASKEYRQIQPTSNELATALSELGWAELMADDHTKAVGAAINLNSGGLKRTFAPEGPIVMAMAFNEMCHFPQAINAINRFKSQYAESYQFLSKWYDGKAKPGNPYIEIIEHIRNPKNKTSVPERVLSEWIRSSEFLRRQEEINLINKEKTFIQNFRKLAVEEQVEQANNLLRFIQDLKPRYDQVRASFDPNHPKVATLKIELEELRKKVSHYQRLRRSADPFNRIMDYYERTAEPIKTKRIAEINEKLNEIGKRMYRQLIDSFENANFIEAEIYQGASEDIVWRNANPDYEKVSREIAEARPGHPASQVYAWGSVGMAESGVQEIWEDELGAFEVDVIDNCDNKDRYAQLKQKRK